MSREEVVEIKLIKAEIERINAHIKIFKGYGTTLDSIETAIVGNSLNGHDGLVYKIDRINKKIDEYETMKTQFNFSKWIFGIIAVAIIGSYVNEKFSSKNDKQQTETTR